MIGTRLARILLGCLDPETAHGLALWLLRRGMAPRVPSIDDPRLGVRLWGRDFPNPVGLAAGFDKNAVAIGPLLGLGFGFVEVGSITPRPQAGNPKPRVFRLAQDDAVINRLGFPSEGAAAAAARIAVWRGRGGGGLVGVNLGKNSDSPNAAADYAAATRTLAACADYLVINVSSPNTPGLRALQAGAELVKLIAAVRVARDAAALRSAPPLLVKIAPDLTAADLAEIAAVVRSERLDGLIVGNTTLARPDRLDGRHRAEAGGLSGRPLFEPSTRVLAEMYRLTEGRIPLIGVGGVSSGRDAYAKIRAGASLVQLYTALTYQGPELIAGIKTDLLAALDRDGLPDVGAAVGAGLRG